ncbi:type II toxin-antitoxin system YhaV family toxin [Pseudomonas sp. R1-15]|uniref:type II toxin-antitoxin system YhaV family toxin n=1 Tax=Pseudomonas sp. R1-15 TaxID=2817399 RepID=UPI003DA8F525
MTESTIHIENGWALYAHPLFIARLEEITVAVERVMANDPENFHHHPVYKLFDAVSANILINVPSDPTHPCYRQGNTLGRDFKHWFRVKKQGIPPRYRLFFQFRSEAPMTIIYAWLNDERALRKDGDKNDVYAVFTAMLLNGKMPNSYTDLIAACDVLEYGNSTTGTEEE